jgi:hypothetical protein
LRKLLVTAMVSGLLGAGALMIPVSAAPVASTPIGDVYAGGDPATQTGGVAVDGNGTVPGPIGDGYIGVNSTDGGVVACASGTYSESGGNNVIDPTAAPDPNSPCFPSQ